MILNDILKVEEGTDFDSRASAKTEETNIGTVVIHKEAEEEEEEEINIETVVIHKEAEGQNQVLKNKNACRLMDL